MKLVIWLVGWLFRLVLFSGMWSSVCGIWVLAFDTEHFSVESTMSRRRYGMVSVSLPQ
jgi:hypothetical protein